MVLLELITNNVSDNEGSHMEGVSSLESRGVLTPKLSPSRRGEGSRRAWLGAKLLSWALSLKGSLWVFVSVSTWSRFHFPI